jgi:hypothetical protein
MHTLNELTPGVFSVGYYHPDKISRDHSAPNRTEHIHFFVVLFNYKTPMAAAAAVNYLNGGSGRFPSPSTPQAILEKFISRVNS